MPDGEEEGHPDPLQSGTMPRIESNPPTPDNLPEIPESEGAATGVVPVVPEEEDPDASRDEDTAAGA